jgi:hypothetical protein
MFGRRFAIAIIGAIPGIQLFRRSIDQLRGQPVIMRPTRSSLANDTSATMRPPGPSPCRTSASTPPASKSASVAQPIVR